MTRSTTRLSYCFAALAAFAAGCIANRPILPGEPCPCAPGWECDPQGSICVLPGTGGDAAGGMSGAGGAPSCSATCATPAGTEKKLTSVQQIYATVEGKWQICSDTTNWSQIGAPSDVIGIEFGPGSSASSSNGGGSTVGGDAFYLVAGPSGPIRGTGFAYQLTYNVADVTAVNGTFQFNLYSGPGRFTPGHIRYSPCPEELDLGFLIDANGGSWLVVPF